MIHVRALFAEPGLLGEDDGAYFVVGLDPETLKELCDLGDRRDIAELFECVLRTHFCAGTGVVSRLVEIRRQMQDLLDRIIAKSGGDGSGAGPDVAAEEAGASAGQGA